MILYFIFTHENIRQAVKMETSLLAERRPSGAPGEGGAMEMYNDLLVFDEEYETLFRRLFLQAHAEVVKHVASNYLVDMPTDLASVFQEFPDFRKDRDFSLWLRMHDDFPEQYKKTLDIKIEQFIIDYICWRWLETKSPADAATYSGRMAEAAEDIKRLLVRKINPIRRRPSI